MTLAGPISIRVAQESPVEAEGTRQVCVQIADDKGHGSDLEAAREQPRASNEPLTRGSRLWTSVRKAFWSGKTTVLR